MKTHVGGEESDERKHCKNEEVKSCKTSHITNKVSNVAERQTQNIINVPSQKEKKEKDDTAKQARR